MTEETQSTPTKVVVEVPVGDAIWALTEQNAIFRNGHQVLIPHLGVDFIAELMAALSTPEFVSGLNDNRIRMAEVENPVRRENDPMEELAIGPCDVMHPAGVARCERPKGHDGSHHGWMPPGDVLEGSDDVSWDDEPTRVVLPGTNWEGFEVEPTGVGFGANVHHIRAGETEHFESREYANAVMSEEDGTYVVLCAEAYLAWYEQVNPSPMDWTAWVRGDVVYDPTNNHAVVAGRTHEDLVIVDALGEVTQLSVENAEYLSRWKVGIAASHNFDQEG